MINHKIHLPSGVLVRPYQISAYENWRSNNYSGIFAMATGTGKTVTALHCVYQEYLNAVKKQKKDLYHLIILVPTQPLLNQWANEVASWGLKAVYKVSSEHNWRKNLQELLIDHQFGLDIDFAIIATYRSFTNLEFLDILSMLPGDMILIADEAHSLGQKQVRSALSSLKFRKKIGLSATPKRIYDPEGTEALELFFDDSEPYVFNLYMDQAIASGILCKYDYYPKLVELTDEELEEYKKISVLVAKTMGLAKTAENGSILERLLLKRKRIVNKASNKFTTLPEIVKEIKSKEALQFCFTYAPAGDCDETSEIDPINRDNVRIIRKMQKIIETSSPGIKTHAYLGETEEREKVLSNFAKGDIDLLLAINCLDEGIDIPKTKIGIFISSSGNPRQFIQRRGRILRKHPEKSRALIYDMVVIPRIFGNPSEAASFQIQRNLVKNELTRVGYFAKLSENFYDAKEALKRVCEYYNLDLDTIIKELEP